AEVGVLVGADLVHDDGAFGAGVGDDLAEGLFAGALHDADADLLVAIHLEGDQGLGCAQQRDAAARNDAIPNRGAGGMQGIFHAGLLFLHFGLGGRADLDHRDAAGELRQTFLELLAVVIAGGLVDLGTKLLDAPRNGLRLAGAVDDGGVILVHRDALGAAQVFQADAFHLDADIFHNRLAAGQDADVFEHRLAAIAEARGLHRASVQRAAQFVDHEGGERFAFDFLGDDQQRLAGAGDLLQQRQQILHVGDLLLVDQDVGIFQNHFHALGIAHEVRGEIAAVELHAFDGVQFGHHGLGLFHRDHAILADLLHGFGDDVADGVVAVGRNRADLGDHVTGHGLGEFLDFIGDHFDGLIDAALERHRVGAGRHGLYAFAVDALRQDGGSGG